jgi:hypothetical protein
MTLRRRLIAAYLCVLGIILSAGGWFMAGMNVPPAGSSDLPLPVPATAADAMIPSGTAWWRDLPTSAAWPTFVVPVTAETPPAATQTELFP